LSVFFTITNHRQYQHSPHSIFFPLGSLSDPQLVILRSNTDCLIQFAPPNLIRSLFWFEFLNCEFFRYLVRDQAHSSSSWDYFWFTRASQVKILKKLWVMKVEFFVNQETSYWIGSLLAHCSTASKNVKLRLDLLLRTQPLCNLRRIWYLNPKDSRNSHSAVCHHWVARQKENLGWWWCLLYPQDSTV
jgi:hypothetical protein